MTTKTADSKGRIALGVQFANKTFIVEEVDGTELRIIAAEVIPKRELWLHNNKDAKRMVQEGLLQAKTMRFAKHPPKVDEVDAKE